MKNMYYGENGFFHNPSPFPPAQGFQVLYRLVHCMKNHLLHLLLTKSKNRIWRKRISSFVKQNMSLHESYGKDEGENNSYFPINTFLFLVNPSTNPWFKEREYSCRHLEVTCLKWGNTSSLSSLALWFFGSRRNSSVNRMHSWRFSGETKSTATFVHDCAHRIYFYAFKIGKSMLEYKFQKRWRNIYLEISDLMRATCRNKHRISKTLLKSPWLYPWNCFRWRSQITMTENHTKLLNTYQIPPSASVYAPKSGRSIGHELDEQPNHSRKIC